MEDGQQILHQLQQQKQQHLQQNRNSMAAWLKDLQMKQQAQRNKREGVTQGDSNASVKDLASRFEPAPAQPSRSGLKQYASQELLNETNTPNPDTVSLSSVTSSTSSQQSNRMPPPEKLNEITVDTVDCAPSAAKKHDMYLAKPRYDIAQSQIAEELREVEMLNTLVQQTLNNGVSTMAEKRTKKKSVSFCDQVILVATADDDAEEDFIPNPILERVLRGGNVPNSDSSPDTISVSSLENKPATISPPSSDSGVDVVETPMNKAAYYNTNNDVINISQRSSASTSGGDAKSYFSMDPQKAMQMKQHLQSTLNSQTHDMQRQLMLQQQENQKLSALLMQEQRQNQNNQARMAMMRNQINYNPAMDMTNRNKMMSPPLASSPITNEIASPYMPVPNPTGNQFPPQQNMTQQQRLMMNANLTNLRQAMQHSPVNVPGQNAAGSPSGMSPQMNGGGMMYQRPPQQMMNYGYPPQGSYQEPQTPLSPTNGMNYMQPPNPAMLMMMKQQQPLGQVPYQQQQQPATVAAVPQVKKVCFDVGTKGGPSENHPTMKMAKQAMEIQQQQPAVVNGMIPQQQRMMNGYNPNAKTMQCTLCRKKHVIAPAIYCSECDYYLSRFQSNPSPHPLSTSASANSLVNGQGPAVVGNGPTATTLRR